MTALAWLLAALIVLAWRRHRRDTSGTWDTDMTQWDTGTGWGE